MTGTAQRRLAPGRDHDGAVLAQAMLLWRGCGRGHRMASRFTNWRGRVALCPGTSTTLAHAIGWQEEALLEAG